MVEEEARWWPKSVEEKGTIWLPLPKSGQSGTILILRMNLLNNE